MTIVIKPHDECHGTGELPHPEPGAVKPCMSCNGLGVRKRSGGSYATRANADKGIRGRTAERCYFCRGTSQVTNPLKVKCYGCTDGRNLTHFEPGDVLPEDWDIYASFRGEAAKHWAATVKVTIARHGDKGLTWGASMLGLGTVYTATDYGRAWESTDAAVEAKVREDLSKGSQLIQIADKESRVLADNVLVLLTRNGYAVTTAASRQSRPMLPPTYTADVLNRPVS